MAHRRYGVVRNGEHVDGLFDTREQALADIELRKVDDQELVTKGWMTERDRKSTQYWVAETAGAW